MAADNVVRAIQAVLNSKLGDQDFVLDLMSDESVRELAKLTIKEALIQPVRTQRGQFGPREESDSPAVAAARAAADKAAKIIVDEMTSRLVNDDEFRSQVAEAVALALPQAITSYWNTTLVRQQEAAVATMVTMIREKA